uniref:Uncharacterized protein n=1 Tax=Plectus sambesii TaxID=2011161 RepID=A0A914VKX4_9BILA
MDMVSCTNSPCQDSGVSTPQHLPPKDTTVAADRRPVSWVLGGCVLSVSAAMVGERPSAAAVGKPLSVAVGGDCRSVEARCPAAADV